MLRNPILWGGPQSFLHSGIQGRCPCAGVPQSPGCPAKRAALSGSAAGVGEGLSGSHSLLTSRPQLSRHCALSRLLPPSCPHHCLSGCLYLCGVIRFSPETASGWQSGILQGDATLPLVLAARAASSRQASHIYPKGFRYPSLGLTPLQRSQGRVPSAGCYCGVYSEPTEALIFFSSPLTCSGFHPQWKSDSPINAKPWRLQTGGLVEIALHLSKVGGGQKEPGSKSVLSPSTRSPARPSLGLPAALPVCPPPSSLSHQASAQPHPCHPCSPPRSVLC